MRQLTFINVADNVQLSKVQAADLCKTTVFFFFLYTRRHIHKETYRHRVYSPFRPVSFSFLLSPPAYLSPIVPTHNTAGETVTRRVITSCCHHQQEGWLIAQQRYEQQQAIRRAYRRKNVRITPVTPLLPPVIMTRGMQAERQEVGSAL